MDEASRRLSPISATAHPNLDNHCDIGLTTNLACSDILSDDPFDTHPHLPPTNVTMESPKEEAKPQDERQAQAAGGEEGGNDEVCTQRNYC